MGILEKLGLKRAALPEDPSLLSISELANLGVAWAMNGERFDACECWYDRYDESIHMRMCDQSKPLRYLKGCAEWCFCYSNDGPKPDGSEQEAVFSTEIRRWPADAVKSLINRTFTKPLELVKS